MSSQHEAPTAASFNQPQSVHIVVTLIVAVYLVLVAVTLILIFSVPWTMFLYAIEILLRFLGHSLGLGFLSQLHFSLVRLWTFATLVLFVNVVVGYFCACSCFPEAHEEGGSFIRPPRYFGLLHPGELTSAIFPMCIFLSVTGLIWGVVPKSSMLARVHGSITRGRWVEHIRRSTEYLAHDLSVRTRSFSLAIGCSIVTVTARVLPESIRTFAAQTAEDVLIAESETSLDALQLAAREAWDMVWMAVQARRGARPSLSTILRLSALWLLGAASGLATYIQIVTGIPQMFGSSEGVGEFALKLLGLAFAGLLGGWAALTVLKK